MATNDDWKARLNAASAAEAKYLWVLVVLGIFFLAIDARLPSFVTPPEIKVPLVDISLSTAVVWEASPTILYFLILVIAGTHRVYKRAESAIKKAGESEPESVDLHPNAVDFVVYTFPTSNKHVQRILRFAYQFFITLFAVEATYFMWRIWLYRVMLPSSWLFLLLGAISGVFAWIFLIQFWIARWRLR